MGRPAAITPEIARVIALERTRTHSVAALLRVLKTRGVTLSRKTLERFLAGSGAYAGPAAPRPSATVPGPASAPDAPASASDAPASASLPLDPDSDLERLEKSASDTWEAMSGFAVGMRCSDPASARAYGGLARLHADLVARLVELKPRPDQERQALEALGAEARDRLIRRAEESARAHDDLAGQLERAKHLLGIGHARGAA